MKSKKRGNLSMRREIRIVVASGVGGRGGGEMGLSGKRHEGPPG